MITKILQLRSSSMPLGEIAKECGLTIGQVKYQLRKAKLTETTADNHADPLWQQAKNAKKASVPLTDKTPSRAKRAIQEWKLASFYAKNLVKLMVQGPTNLYVYWEITWPRMRMVASYFQSDYQMIQKGLRLYDVTDRFFDGTNAHWSRDVLVNEEASCWYIHDVQPDRTYIVDFGLFHDGRFCPILRSEPAATPRNHMAVWGEPLIQQTSEVRYPKWFENFSSYSVYSK